MSANTLAIYGLAAAAACALTYGAVKFHEMSTNYAKLQTFISELPENPIFTLDNSQTGTCDFIQQRGGQYSVKFRAEGVEIQLFNLTLNVDNEVVGSTSLGKPHVLSPLKVIGGKKRRKRRSRAWR